MIKKIISVRKYNEINASNINLNLYFFNYQIVLISNTDDMNSETNYI